LINGVKSAGFAPSGDLALMAGTLSMILKILADVILALVMAAIAGVAYEKAIPPV